MAAPPGYPVRIRQATCNIAGQDTHVLLTAYADRLLVVATHVGTLGTVLLAEREAVLGGGSTYRVETLVGLRDDPHYELCARQLAERLAEAGCDKPLVLCLGLSRGASSPQVVRQVVAAVLDNPVW